VCRLRMSIRIYLIYCVFFEVSLLVLFKVIHTIFPSTLLFDQILFISCLNIMFFLILVNKRIKLSFDKMVAIISLGLSLMFLNQTFVLNVDRSRSTFVLSWVEKGYVSIDTTGSFLLEGILSKENSNELGTIQRVRENIDRGLISVKGETVELTLVGHLLLHICEGTANLFNLQGWKTNSQ
jgi:hypothetical protein